MYINNMVRYAYYSNLWNNNVSTSSAPMINSVNQSVRTALKSTEVNNVSNYNIHKLTSAVSLKTDAEQLSKSAKKITNNTDSGTFAQKVALSEDSTKITASAENGAYNTTYAINIDQIAKAQTNASNLVDKSQLSSMQAGTNTISITSGGKSKDIDFSISNGDTNEVALNKMAKAINASQSGVNALIVKDSSDNNIKLQLTSDKTGTSNVFSITDKIGNSVASTGINSISSNAADAKYKLNNIEYTSNSNEVTTGGVTFTLKNTTSNAVKVTVKQDSSKIGEDINNFVQDYNNLIKDARNSGISNSNALKGINSIIDRSKSSLEKIGITVNKDDTLSVDKNKLNNKIENDIKTVKDTFNSYQGVATKIKNYSSSIAKNPFTAVGVNTIDVYNKGLISSSNYLNQGSVLNLYR
ncbi:flagellar filament capping protein FliD [Clostridium sp. PL3]|uniref:Flagellar filament capping protein FliD n=1 Tax=Clostridium thailandense TaxID=2794346 RepID=A0A949TQ82_9CLOT|nr:flagellar filament capping protein FliD [Clostridium thailandense]MBV7274562.1 flagellar filament capping protein FliD [Clostridium thailandense]